MHHVTFLFQSVATMWNWLHSLVLFLGACIIQYMCTVNHHPSFAAFGWIRAEVITLYIFEFILLLLSAVPSTVDTSYPVALAAICVYPAHYLHHVWEMMWFASDHVPILVCFLFEFFKYILVSSVQRLLPGRLIKMLLFFPLILLWSSCSSVIAVVCTLN